MLLPNIQKCFVYRPVHFLCWMEICGSFNFDTPHQCALISITVLWENSCTWYCHWTIDSVQWICFTDCFFSWMSQTSGCGTSLLIELQFRWAGSEHMQGLSFKLTFIKKPKLCLTNWWCTVDNRTDQKMPAVAWPSFEFCGQHDKQARILSLSSYCKHMVNIFVVLGVSWGLADFP